MTDCLRKPNLFVIGSMKSGTTSLHEYLNEHPLIAMSSQKEPAYFAQEFTLNRGESWYLSLFSQDPKYRYRGESSTQYTRIPLFKGIPERIHTFNPNARLIYIMRNPFDRLISHYWHAVRVRRIRSGRGEPRSLLKAVRNSRDEYLATGDYAMQLAPYIKLFGHSSLYTLTFESLLLNPQTELNKLFAWLELPEHSLGTQLTQIHNQKPEGVTSAAGFGILYRLQFSNAWHTVAPAFPASLKKLARRIAYRNPDADQLQRDISQLRAEVAKELHEQISSLSGLLGRDFPEWRDDR